jgi:hypothetical protein
MSSTEYPPRPSELNFSVTGGTLRPDAPSYVQRQADGELFEALLRAEFCYVLTARQMDKSSAFLRKGQPVTRRLLAASYR